MYTSLFIILIGGLVAPLPDLRISSLQVDPGRCLKEQRLSRLSSEDSDSEEELETQQSSNTFRYIHSHTEWPPKRSVKPRAEISNLARIRLRDLLSCNQVQ